MRFSFHRRALLTGLGLLLAGHAFAPAAVLTNETDAASAAPTVLTRVRSIKALSSDQADQRQRVRLEAVVTYFDPSWNLLTVADRSGGIFVAPASRGLTIEFGQQVVIEGVTGAGGFAPIVQEAQIKTGQKTELPVPRSLSEMDVMTGRQDNEWVELKGIVLSAKSSDDHTDFRIATRFGVMAGTLPRSSTAETLRQLADATVQIQAVCGSASNEKRQFTAVHLWIPNLECLRILEPAVLDAATLPQHPISSLLQYDAHRGMGSRVRVQGVVTFQQDANLFFIQDSSDGTRVQTREPVALKLGDVVDAVGYPAIDGYSPTLQDAIVHQVGISNQPQPMTTSIEKLFRGVGDLRIIQVKARLLEKIQRKGAMLLSLQSEDRYFEARLDKEGGRLSHLRDGSELQLVGVCDVKVNEQREPTTFVILLRNEKDVQILATPYWWTPERASTVLGFTSLLILVAVAWVTLLRRRVTLQTKQIRKSIEQEAALESRYRNLFESARDFIFTCDENGRFTSFNRSGTRLTDLTEQEALTKSIFELTPPVNHCALRKLLAPESPTDPSQRQELELLTKTGQRRIVDLTLTYLSMPGGVREVQGIARDVTERKRMELDLLEARDLAIEGARQKAEFLANMSHEIRTPMNGVIGMTNLLLGTPLSQQQQDFAETIRTSAEALLTVVNDILDFSKIEAGKLAFESLDFDLRETVEGALEVLAAKADTKGLELGCSISPETPTALRGDPMRLRQILTNLIGNAVKFTEQGEVMVSVQLVSESAHLATLRFEVQDTGIGIPVAAQARLFQPFSQADGSNARRFGGTGLGLAISRQLVEMMQGRVGLKSEPGHGSTFWFVVELAKQVKPVPNPSTALPDWSNLQVLVVDDNQSNRQILEHQINSWRMHGTSVSNGTDALEVLRREAVEGRPYDLALLDMQMPTMDGLTLAKAIKADPILTKTRLIILSSLGHPLSENELRTGDVAACLHKPVKQSRLFDCLATVMGSAASESKPHTVPEISAPGVQPQLVRLLLAEDNAVNQKVALGQLQRLGYRADVVTNGVQVLQALERSRYDVILMDCQMPELDGYETTQRIRKQEQQDSRIPNRRLHIIAMTAHAMKGDREKCLEAGMDDYISKPIRTEELGAALARCPAPEPEFEETFASDDAAVATASRTQEVAPASVRQAPPIEVDRLLEAVGGVEEEAHALAVFYLEQAREMLEGLETAVKAMAISDIEHLSHKLAGASASCGAISLLPTLRDLEHTARAGELSEAKAKSLFEESRQRFGEVEQFLGNHFAHLQSA